MSPVDPSSPFSDANLRRAAQAEANRPANQIEAGVIYDETNGLTAEVEGEKALGHGWYLSGDATYSQRLKFAGQVLFGWKGK